MAHRRENTGEYGDAVEENLLPADDIGKATHGYEEDAHAQKKRRGNPAHGCWAHPKLPPYGRNGNGKRCRHERCEKRRESGDEKGGELFPSIPGRLNRPHGPFHGYPIFLSL